MSEPMTNTCPVCGARQDAGLLCAADTDKLEHALHAVPGLVTELATTASKMAKIGNPSGGGGLARERSPISWGAVEAADNLGNVLTTWARDVAAWVPSKRIWLDSRPACRVASAVLLGRIPEIRRHPAVAELVDEITDAVEQARRAIDRPQERQYLGQCMVKLPDPDQPVVVYCYAELWARVDATETTCRTCGITHDVTERRAWLLLQAADMLTTVKEASRYIGDVGGIPVTEASIRGLIHRKKLGYRVGTTTFRLGDLLDVLTDRAAVTSAGDAVVISAGDAA